LGRELLNIIDKIVATAKSLSNNSFNILNKILKILQLVFVWFVAIFVFISISEMTLKRKKRNKVKDFCLVTRNTLPQFVFLSGVLLVFDLCDGLDWKSDDLSTSRSLSSAVGLSGPYPHAGENKIPFPIMAFS
jgi:hypothetical protein